MCRARAPPSRLAEALLLCPPSGNSMPVCSSTHSSMSPKTRDRKASSICAGSVRVTSRSSDNRSVSKQHVFGQVPPLDIQLSASAGC